MKELNKITLINNVVRQFASFNDCNHLSTHYSKISSKR